MGFSADAGLFVAAEWCACREVVVGVDPHTSGAYSTCYFQSGVDVLAEYCAAEAVYAVVCQSNDFVSCLEFLYNDNWSKDFFLAYAAVIVSCDQDSRFHEEAFVAAVFGVAFAAGYEGCAFFEADLDVTEDFILLCFVDLSAQLGGRIGRVAYFDAFEGCFQMFDEFIENAFLNEEAGACAAYLALVEEDAFACAVDSLLHMPV